MPRCELPLKFNDSDELIVLKSAAIIKAIPVLDKAMGMYSSNWTDADVIVTEAVEIPFDREYGAFLISLVEKCQVPDAELSQPEDYPELNAKSLPELRELMELANYLECVTFMKAAAFIVSRKMTGGIPQIAEFIGVEYLDEQHIFDPKDGWEQVHDDPTPSQDA